MDVLKAQQNYNSESAPLLYTRSETNFPFLFKDKISHHSLYIELSDKSFIFRNLVKDKGVGAAAGFLERVELSPSKPCERGLDCSLHKVCVIVARNKSKSSP